MDKLGKRVEIERENFEVYDFDVESAWNDIEVGLNEKRKITGKQKWLPTILRFAAVFAIFLAIWFTYRYVSNEAPNELVSESISLEFKEMEIYYSMEIKERLRVVKTHLSDDDQFIDEYHQLELAYEGLKADLRDNTDNEEVINAMILNYQLRLEILEGMLLEIKEKTNEFEGDIVL